MTLAAPEDVAAARRVAQNAMKELGASVIRQTKFVTAVSEIARNAVIHGRGGSIRFELSPRALRAVCSDSGPGIADIDMAMSDGFTTRGGLGLGLGGARRLVDRFEIASSAVAGTRVTLVCEER